MQGTRTSSASLRLVTSVACVPASARGRGITRAVSSFATPGRCKAPSPSASSSGGDGGTPAGGAGRCAPCLVVDRAPPCSRRRWGIARASVFAPCVVPERSASRRGLQQPSLSLDPAVADPASEVGAGLAASRPRPSPSWCEPTTAERDAQREHVLLEASTLLRLNFFSHLLK
jgi:hypothetical protein